jgi:hypothetical protein
MEEKKIEAFEKRKNREQSKKFNKQLSLMKKSEKNKETNNFNREIERVKKSTDGNKDEKLERILNSEHHADNRGAGRGGGGRDGGGRFGGAGGRGGRGGRGGGDRNQPEKSKRRQGMDKKYGFGGKDGKRAKLNDSK